MAQILRERVFVLSLLSFFSADGIIDRNIMFGNVKAQSMLQHLMIKYLICQGLVTLRQGKLGG